jgi:hypothetical protein
MGKILNKAKNVGKNYYFYFALYWIGLIGTYEALILLGLIWSLPILAYTFLQKITRILAICVSGIIFVVITIIYWISTTGVETFVEEVKIALIPFLFLFVLYSGFIIGIKGAKKIR